MGRYTLMMIKKMPEEAKKIAEQIIGNIVNIQKEYKVKKYE